MGICFLLFFFIISIHIQSIDCISFHLISSHFISRAPRIKFQLRHEIGCKRPGRLVIVAAYVGLSAQPFRLLPFIM